MQSHRHSTTICYFFNAQMFGQFTIATTSQQVDHINLGQFHINLGQFHINLGQYHINLGQFHINLGQFLVYISPCPQDQVCSSCSARLWVWSPVWIVGMLMIPRSSSFKKKQQNSRPYFLGGGGIRGVPLDSHHFISFTPYPCGKWSNFTSIVQLGGPTTNYQGNPSCPPKATPPANKALLRAY